MNNKEFIKKIAAETGYSQGSIKEVFEAAETVLIEQLKTDDEVKVIKGITIVPHVQDAHVVPNPFSGGTTEVPKRRIIKAKFSQSLKDVVKEC